MSKASVPAEAVQPEQASAMIVKNAPSLVQRISEKYGVDPSKMIDTLQKTCFRPSKDGKQVTTEQMMMLMVVADQYSLNPFTREIYAFPTKDGGIQPIIGIDGWIRMMNEHPQFDGVQFEYGPILESTNEKGEKSPVVVNEWIEVLIHRKDRTHPIRVKEYIVECRRPTEPWREMPRRMLRHKTLIQGIRYAFGFAGYDEDDFERMNESREPESTAPAPMVPGRHHVPKSGKEAPVQEPVKDPDPPAPAVDDDGAIDAQAVVKETVTDDGEVLSQEDEIRREEAINSIEQSLKEDMTAARIADLQSYIDKCRPLIGDAYHQNFFHRLRQKQGQPTGKTRKLF